MHLQNYLIVTNAGSEHKSAIEWLNNNTKNDINFFN